MKKILFFVLMTISAINLMAQVSVEARIDSIQMLIGQQVHVTVTAAAPEHKNVVFQQFKPSQFVTPGVEVLECSDTHTAKGDDGLMLYSRIYTLTSFDEKLYYLPPFSVKIDGKVYKSKSLALKVLDVEVDTVHTEKFFGPKAVQDNPFMWADWSTIFWLSVIVLLMGGIAYYLYLRLRDNKPVIANIRIIKRILPHQKAMNAIEKLKEEKLVTADNPKEYYTKLTDTLRTYIKERYGFNAMEMTSAEIIEHLTDMQDRKAIDELTQLFTTADLVKFAKYSTLINENDRNLVNAIEFINSTKLENQPVTETVKPQLTEEDLHNRKERRILRLSIWSVSIIAVVLLLYVVYSFYQLLI